MLLGGTCNNYNYFILVGISWHNSMIMSLEYEYFLETFNVPSSILLEEGIFVLFVFWEDI